MNQATHAWLAVEAYRKIAVLAKTDEGKKRKLGGLERLLGENLKDVVVAAWLPDSLIKDMQYGHIFKNSNYTGTQRARFILKKEDLKKHLVGSARVPKVAFDAVPDAWWKRPYRVKDNGGHLPARVNALCQTARDMLRMGDDDVIALTEIVPKGAESINKAFRSSPRDIAMMLWMVSHYVADAHMPLHCDNRGFASTAKQKTHCAVEELWGKQVADLFYSKQILKKNADAILGAKPPEGSMFAALDFGDRVDLLKNNGDPWSEAVFICRASFAASFALVPEKIAKVDDVTKRVSLDDIRTCDFCGEDRFWALSQAIMADAASAIAMFWQDVWLDFTCKKKVKAQ